MWELLPASCKRERIRAACVCSCCLRSRAAATQPTAPASVVCTLVLHRTNPMAWQSCFLRIYFFSGRIFSRRKVSIKRQFSRRLVLTQPGLESNMYPKFLPCGNQNSICVSSTPILAASLFATSSHVHCQLSQNETTVFVSRSRQYMMLPIAAAFEIFFLFVFTCFQICDWAHRK